MMAKPNPVRAPFATWAGIIGLAAMALGGAAVIFLFDPSHNAFYPQCLFHRWTGWNCPGCGSLRGMYQLLHGHLMLALRCNALLILSLPYVAFYSVREFFRWRAGLPMFLPELRPPQIFLFLGVLLVFTILRNIPAAPFVYLSPP